MKITLAHARSALGKGNKNACNRGLRLWFKSHNLDLNDFIKNGIDIEQAKMIDDPIAKKIIEVAENGIR